MTSVPHTFASPFTSALLGGNTSAQSRFEHNIVTAELIALRANQGASRSRLQNLVLHSMKQQELTPQQQASLENLGKNDSVVVATGQQIGMFGGPLYTILKIASAAARAKELSAEFDVPVIPVFWLEDNDHDAQEASETTVLQGATTLVDIDVWNAAPARTPVWKYTFSEEQTAIITSAASTFSGEFAADTQAQIAEVYAAGNTWADSFLRILQPYIGEWGVLVVRGSELVAQGLHQPLVLADLLKPGTYSGLLNQGTQHLEQLGYPAQAAVAPMLFFKHVDNTRVRLEISDITADTIEHAKKSPQDFSPNVLARPLVQDAVLPTVLNILGAAEIHYHAQLKELYAEIGIAQPVVQLRSSATFVDAKTQRHLTKLNMAVTDFLQPYHALEQSIVAQFATDVIPSIESQPQLLHSVFAAYVAAAAEIDVTLQATVSAAEATTKNALFALEGKLRAALKRNNTQTLERVLAVSTMIFPKNALQERIFPLLWWQSRIGTNQLRIIVEQVCSESSSSHKIMSI